MITPRSKIPDTTATMITQSGSSAGGSSTSSESMVTANWYHKMERKSRNKVWLLYVENTTLPADDLTLHGDTY